MKELREIHVVLAEHEILSAIRNLERKLRLVLKNNASRTDLISEFTEDKDNLTNALLTLNQLKHDYKTMSVRFAEISLINAKQEQELKELREDNRLMEKKMHEILKF